MALVTEQANPVLVSFKGKPKEDSYPQWTSLTGRW